MNFWQILYILDWILFIPVAFTVAYIFIFSISALFLNKRIPNKAKQEHIFIVLIPAYKSDKIIIDTINSILGQAYPQRNFDVVVVSDHQSEMTNMRLAQLPITLLTPNFENSSKAKSLQYAILNLPQFKIYDAVIVLDAGNVVDPDFLKEVNEAYDTSGSKVIQCHRIARNNDTPIARLEAIFEEINNTIFRKGHLAVGLSSALNSSGTIFDFQWFKQNIMKVRTTVGEDKELEAMLAHEGIFVDYFEHIHIYDIKSHHSKEFNSQHGRWIYAQLYALVSNIRHLPNALMNSHYDYIDKIIQWGLIPRMILTRIIIVMSLVLPFIYLTSAIKWWIIAAIILFAYSLATPNYLVDKNWDKDFLHTPQIILGGFFSFHTGRNKTENPKESFFHRLKNLVSFKKKQK